LLFLMGAALALPAGSFAKHADRDFKQEEKQARKDDKELDKAFRKWLKAQGKEEKAWERRARRNGRNS